MQRGSAVVAFAVAQKVPIHAATDSRTKSSLTRGTNSILHSASRYRKLIVRLFQECNSKSEPAFQPFNSISLIEQDSCFKSSYTQEKKLAMPPHSKRRKTSAVAEVVFDPAARQEYLTGFHKRKQARIKHAQEIAVKREKEEKRQEREEVCHISTHTNTNYFTLLENSG